MKTVFYKNANEDGKERRIEFKRRESEAGQDTGSGLKGDYLNLLLLLILYFLQGIPIGIIEAIPLILVNRGVTYDKQAIFSFALWPFSVKLLWAPLVDAYYVRRFGRRKSWFVPVQYAMGFLMILLSFTIEDFIGHESKQSHQAGPNVMLLTFCFILLTFLAASQDIAVDGWALTMLKKRNIEYATTCNSVGQTIGILFGSTLFLALESTSFSNRWLRTTPLPHGIVTLGSYLRFWGVIFIIITTFVTLFKREIDDRIEEGKIGVMDTYKMLWKILQLRSVQWLAVVLLTHKIGFAPADAVTQLKIVEYGFKRENLGLIRLPLLPLKIVMPWVVTRFSKKKPLNALFYTYPFRLFMALTFALLVWFTYLSRYPNGSFPGSYYIIVACGFGVQLLAYYCTTMTIWAFVASVSDPLIGGTYMTLLMTLNNLGGNWIQTLSIYLVKPLTFDWCPDEEIGCSTPTSGNHTEPALPALVTVDGYYVETAICLAIGVMWMIFMRKTLKWLESIPKVDWHCK